eukprot:scaffold22218_cov63-Phaeocystis_antarctica.AAC.2
MIRSSGCWPMLRSSSGLGSGFGCAPFLTMSMSERLYSPSSCPMIPTLRSPLGMANVSTSRQPLQKAVVES